MHAAPQHPDPVEAITGLQDMAFLNAQTLMPLKALRPPACRPQVSDISAQAQTLVRLCGESLCSSIAADTGYGLSGGTNIGAHSLTHTLVLRADPAAAEFSPSSRHMYQRFTVMQALGSHPRLCGACKMTNGLFARVNGSAWATHGVDQRTEKFPLPQSDGTFPQAIRTNRQRNQRSQTIMGVPCLCPSRARRTGQLPH